MLPDEPLPVESFAAEDLAHHVKLATGADLAIVPEADTPAEGDRVFIGATRAAAEAGLSAEGLSPNAFIIHAGADRLFVLGDDGEGEPGWILHNNRTRVGTLFGVYHLLDRELGARWLWPGRWEIVPEQASIGFKALSDRRARVRACALAGWRDSGRGDGQLELPANRSSFIAEQSRWLRRRRFALGVNMDIAHRLTAWFERYGEERESTCSRRHQTLDPTYHGSPRLIAMDVSGGAAQAIVELAADAHGGRSVHRRGRDIRPGSAHATCLSWDVPDPLESRGAPGACMSRLRAAGERDWIPFLGSLSDRYAQFFLAVQAGAEARSGGRGDRLRLLELPSRHAGAMLNDHIYIGIVPGSWMFGDEGAVAEMLDSGTAGRPQARGCCPSYMLDGHNMPIYAADASAALPAAQHGMIATDFDSLDGPGAAQAPTVISRATARPG